jgi:PPOX class probable F420-dependent enzyme
MNESEALARLESARVGVLGTTDARGRPHLVPITYALIGRRLVHMIDHKPKRTMDLKRLDNIRSNPTTTLLVQSYDEDWRSLWWVRVDGMAYVAEDGSDREAAMSALVAKYDQYRDQPPGGPAVLMDIERVTGWDWSE